MAKESTRMGVMQTRVAERGLKRRYKEAMGARDSAE
jgi:hypothetical protein